MSASRTARDRARAELTREIKQEARRRLAEGGAAQLSLRAVARRLGMASSALYRYFPSRDDLLTALIIDAYDAAGRRAEAADEAADEADLAGRWRASCLALRAWAVAHPHEYALIYGSPVPGYRAPTDTIGPAARVPRALAAPLVDGWRSGRLATPPPAERITPETLAEAERLADAFSPAVPPTVMVRALIAWSQVLGLISLELFGHLTGVIERTDAVFAHAVELMASFQGLTLGTGPADAAGGVPGHAPAHPGGVPGGPACAGEPGKRV